MRAGSVIVLLVLLAAVWWQTDQLSEARTRNKLLTETATGYEQVIQEVKTTAIQTHKLLAEVKVREQQRNAEGERRREAMQAVFNGDTCAVTPVPDAVSRSLQKRKAVGGVRTMVPGLEKGRVQGGAIGVQELLLGGFLGVTGV